MNILAKFFSTRYMVKNQNRIGEVPSNRVAYGTAVAIALPAVAEMVSISVIGMADTAMVGRLGSYAVSAVGLTGQPRMIFLSLFFALNVGVTAIVSRRKGEGDQKAARLCLRQSLLIELFVVAIMTALAVGMAGWMMTLAGAQSDTHGPAVEYFKILGWGFIFNAMTMTICAAQRGVGNTRVTMTVNLTANVVNVVFNFLLIEGRFGFPRLEVRGAALATVLGYAVGFVLALRSVMYKDSYLRISFKDSWKPDFKMMRNIAVVGGNSVFEQLALRVGFFLYARIVADLGTDSFAAHQIGMQLMNLSFTFADGIGVATTSLVGQNLGKKRPDLAIMYGKIGQRFAVCIAIVIGAASIAGRFKFPWLFTDEKHIIDMAAQLIMVLGFMLPIQTTQIVMAGSLRGSGDTRFVALTMLITVGVIRPGVSFLFVNAMQLGLIGAWYAIVVDQIVRCALLYRRFSQGKWLSIKL